MIMLDTMNIVIDNLAKNKKQIDAALAETEATIGTFTPDVQAALDFLVKTFSGDAKLATNMFTAVAQREKLSAASGEVGALLAAVQVVIADEDLLEATQAQATANAEVANNPLPPAAGVSESPAADTTGSASTEAAAAPAETGQV